VKAQIARVTLLVLAMLVLALGPAVVVDAQLPTVPALESASSADHIHAAQKFLTAWGRGQWEELRDVAANEVTIRIGDRAYVLAPGAAKSDVMLVFPYRGLSTVRVDGKVKGITVEDLGLQVGHEQVRGTGTLTLQEDGGSFRVVGVSTGH
jgi:hypothetical protein